MNNQLIFDEVRKLWVAATPEEVVRQKLLKTMIYELNFPRDLLAVEKDLRLLPHLNQSPVHLPDRRADVICFAKEIHPKHILYPLLLIECKEEALNQKAANQLLGYNHFVNAYFVALANHSEIRLGYYDDKLKAYRFIKNLPTFQKLLSLVQHVHF